MLDNENKIIFYSEERPWGKFENILDEPYCKVKRITVNPDQRLSYQYHHKRAEHWVIVQGVAKVTLDGEEKEFKAGENIYVPVGVSHRIKNVGSGKLIFIEVQCGSYFGEDDIVRVSDDYGR